MISEVVHLQQLAVSPAVIRRQVSRAALPRLVLHGHWQDEWNADPSRIHTDVYYLLEA
jgi:hypothetical protein